MRSFETNEKIKQFKHWLDSIEHSTNDQSSVFSTPRRETFLHEKGRQYQARKLKKKQLLEEQEREKLPFYPLTNKTPTKGSQLQVVDRLLAAGDLYKTKLEKQRKAKAQQEQEEQEELQSMHKSTSPSRVENRLTAIGQVYQQRKEDLKLKLETQEKSLCRPPEICKKSQEIFESCGHPHKVEQRLLDNGSRSKEILRTKRVLKELAKKWSSKPNISPMAKRLKRNCEVSQRLYNFYTVYQERRKQKQLMQESSWTPEPSYRSPKDSKKSRERLLRKKTAKTPDSSFSFKPMISKKSSALASRMGKSFERLTRSPTPEVFEIEDPECCFKPLVNSKSSKLDNRQKHNSKKKLDRCEALYELSNFYQERRKFLIEQNTFDSDQNCTFQPKKKVDFEKLVSKLNGWATDRDERLKLTRDRELQDEIEECSFTPEIHPPKKFAQKDLKEFKGVKQFLKRQEEARPKLPQNPTVQSKCKKLNASQFLQALQTLHEDLHK